MEIFQLVESYEARFTAEGVDNAKRVTEELLAHVFNCKPLEIYLHTVPLLVDKFHLLELLAKRIENGEPLQYVVGHVDFWGLEIKCDPRALIPRPETELLVEEVLNSTIWKSKPATVIDVGTGTGCIALTLAKQRPDDYFTAVDISPNALDLAKGNARVHALEDRVVWKENNLLEGFSPESCNGVVANLPYIASADWAALSSSVRDHEPQSALDSGPSGMELIIQLAEQARDVLIPGGILFLEFGFDQGKSVFQCLDKLGYADIEIKHDLAGLDRIAIATNP
ncbi:MAG: peptide chain release factor N(5)-glutamine methyltransferase [Pontiella sp.]